MRGYLKRCGIATLENVSVDSASSLHYLVEQEEMRDVDVVDGDNRCTHVKAHTWQI